MNRKIKNNIFKLAESDTYVGSFISREDVKTILNVSDKDLSVLSFSEYNGEYYIDEYELKKEWEGKHIPHAPSNYNNGKRRSLDELILAAIIKQTFPDAQILHQIKWGRKSIDLEVYMDSKHFFVEFHGPGHFISQYGRDVEDPFIRKDAIEKDCSCECFIWPYWVQRCSLNLKILIGEDTKSNGKGALWSTKKHFGQFTWEDSASIIEKLTEPFRAAPDGEYGYFYDGSHNNDWVKTEHPIVKKIIDGKSDYDLLVPKGVHEKDIPKWLPGKIKQKFFNNQ